MSSIETTKTEAERADEARRCRRSLAGALLHWQGSTDESSIDEPSTRTYGGICAVPLRETRATLGSLAPAARYRLRGAILDDPERTTLLVDGRDVPWPLDLQEEGARLAACESSAILLWHCRRRAWVRRPLGCGSRLCPVCGRARSLRALARWLPVVKAAQDDGREIWHITLTQRAFAREGGLVLPWEAVRGWEGRYEPGETHVSVGGEPLKRAYHRLRNHLRAVRDSREAGRRELWREGLGGYLLGTEWTGRSKRSGVPRWHAHCHILAVRTPWAPHPGELVEDWCRATGAHPDAQVPYLCGPERVAEVLKYPFKHAGLTQGQRIEVAAAARGLRPHQPGGPLHPRSRDYGRASWTSYRAARQEHSPYAILEVRGDDGAVGPYYGAITEGERCWQLRVPGEARPRRWRAEAGPYAEILAQAPVGDGDWPEPGADLDEWID